ncbi:MAG: hypothetical protein Q9223_006932 [Gallowayella weberi]
MVRIKHRYLLVNILYPEPPKSKEPRHQSSNVPDLVQIRRPTSDHLSPSLLAKAIRDQILLMYGDYGSGITSTGLLVKYLSPATSTAIVRCSRANYQIVWAALTFMTHLPRLPDQDKLQPCVMQVVRVSGTIRKAEEEVIRRARAAILKAKREDQEADPYGLDAILGPANERTSSKRHGKDVDPPIGIEDEDEGEDDDEDSDDVDEDG